MTSEEHTSECTKSRFQALHNNENVDIICFRRLYFRNILIKTEFTTSSVIQK